MSTEHIPQTKVAKITLFFSLRKCQRPLFGQQSGAFPNSLSDILFYSRRSGDNIIFFVKQIVSFIIFSLKKNDDEVSENKKNPINTRIKAVKTAKGLPSKPRDEAGADDDSKSKKKPR